MSCGTETKNQWARDDPAFVVVIMSFMLASSLAFSLAFKATTRTPPRDNLIHNRWAPCTTSFE